MIHNRYEVAQEDMEGSNLFLEYVSKKCDALQMALLLAKEPMEKVGCMHKAVVVDLMSSKRHKLKWTFKAQEGMITLTKLCDGGKISNSVAHIISLPIEEFAIPQGY